MLLLLLLLWQNAKEKELTGWKSYFAQGFRWFLSSSLGGHGGAEQFISCQPGNRETRREKERELRRRANICVRGYFPPSILSSSPTYWWCSPQSGQVCPTQLILFGNIFMDMLQVCFSNPCVLHCDAAGKMNHHRRQRWSSSLLSCSVWWEWGCLVPPHIRSPWETAQSWENNTEKDKSNLLHT